MTQKPRRRPKPRKTARPQVIDLKAEEVADAENSDESKSGAAPEAAGADASQQAPDETAGTTSPEASGDAPAKETAAAQSDPDKADGEPAEEGATAQSDADTADAEVTPDEAPKQAGGGGSGKLIAAGLAALIIAGGAGAWAYRTYGGGTDSAAVAQIEALQQQVAELGKANQINAEKLSRLEAAVASAQTATAQSLASIEQAGTARQEKTQAALDKVTAAISSAATDGAGGAAGQAANAMKIDELGQGLAAVAAKLDEVAGKVDGSGGEELKAQVMAVSETLEAMKAQQEARATQTVSALGQSFGKLTAAVDGGGPFEAELDALVATAPTLPGIAELRDAAKTGVPSLGILAGELDGLAAAVAAKREETAAAASEDSGVLSALTSQLTKVVKIRKVGEIDWVDLLKQSAATVRGGDLAAAVQSLAGHGEAAPEGVSGWLERAGARLALNAAMEKLSQAVLRQLAASKTSG